MNFNSLPSLEDTAIIKVAILLWTPDDIRASMARPSSSKLSQIFVSDKKKYQELEKKILLKISHLSLHMHLKNKLEAFVEMIGCQILSWLKHHFAIYFCEDLPKFSWTLYGKIDHKKTAELLIKDDNVDITSRYILACIYCLNFDIKKLWYKMPENRRKQFYSGKKPSEVRQHKLVLYWTYFYFDKFDMIYRISGRQRSLNQYAFEISVEDGNLAATKYFFRELSYDEKNEFLDKAARQTAMELKCTSEKFDFKVEGRIEVLIFLLSQADEKKQKELLETYPCLVLRCFLHWPRQCLFIETAKYACKYLSENDYETLLKYIIYRVLDGYKDYDYQKLFGEFWRLSPDFLQKYIINITNYDDVLSELFYLKDVENIRLILKSATATEREKIIFSHSGKRICVNIIEAGLKYLLEFFISECIISKNTMIRFKEEFQEFLGAFKQSRPKFYAVFFSKLMDELIDKNDRMSEDENSSN